MKEIMDEEYFDVSEVKQKGDDIRKRILDDTKIDINKTSPNLFNYIMHKDSLGLNEISNVDMGYACSRGTDLNQSYSKRIPYLNELEYNVELMRQSDNSILFLNGGLFTYIPKNRGNELLSYKDQVAYFYSLLKDLATDGKIVAMVRGTEEHRILKNHKVDVLGILQDALRLDKKVCNDALVNIQIEDELLGRKPVGIRTINWNNSATTGSYIGRKMEERATKRSGADIYLARTTMNYFKTSLQGESAIGGADTYTKPIYLISSGGYTPFKGAVTAGAEYNSIKDGELCPPSYWYKVTVEPRMPEFDGDRDYVVKVNPINYNAHQVLYQGTDKVTANIENLITSATDTFIQKVVSKYPGIMSKLREEGTKDIRKTLIENKSILKRNEEIDKYLNFLQGIETDKKTSAIEDNGSNVSKQQNAETIDKEL